MISDKAQRETWAFEREERWFDQMLTRVLDPDHQKFWKMDFRINGRTFMDVVELVRDRMERNDTNFRKAIPLEKRVAIALWRLANGNSYRTISKTFGVGKSTSVEITKEFCQTISSRADEFIRFPQSMRETAEAIAKFKDDYNCKIPQVVGAIDATHIHILGPPGESKADYFCRKQHYSMNTQAVVGENLKFIDVATGCPRSVHDSRVLRHSHLFQKAETNQILVSPVKEVDGLDIRPLLLGDGGYFLNTWLMKPYPMHLRLSPAQRNFNRKLSSCRSSVERAFGLLKSRWRCLLKRLDSIKQNIPEIIITCCVLHNLCQQNNDNYYDDDNILQEVLRQEGEHRRKQGQIMRQVNEEREAENVRTVIRNSIFR